MIRLDSNIASVSHHWCCEQLRICVGKDYCSQNDIDHANLFRGPAEEEPLCVTEDIAKAVRQKIDAISHKYKERKYYNKRGRKPEFIPMDEIGGYIDYYCSILGFHELIFPVAIEGRILGAIFCGQVDIEGDMIRICSHY